MATTTYDRRRIFRMIDVLDVKYCTIEAQCVACALLLLGGIVQLIWVGL